MVLPMDLTEIDKHSELVQRVLQQLSKVSWRYREAMNSTAVYNVRYHRGSAV